MVLEEARQLARETMNGYGLTGWRLEFDRSIRRFGQTRFHTKTISLSRPLVELNNKVQVYDTILHEVAHALVGMGNGHNRVWKQQALAIGCDASRCYDSTQVLTPPKAFVGTCPSCYREIERHRRTDIACGKCCRAYNGNEYSDNYKFNWRRR